MTVETVELILENDGDVREPILGITCCATVTRLELIFDDECAEVADELLLFTVDETTAATLPEPLLEVGRADALMWLLFGLGREAPTDEVVLEVNVMDDEELFLCVREFDVVAIQLALGDDDATMETIISALDVEAVTLAVSVLLPVGVVALMVELIFDADANFEGAMLVTELHLGFDAVLFLVETTLPVMVLDFEETALVAVELLLEEATLPPVDNPFKGLALATEELLFRDRATAAVNELFFEETVLVVVELLLEMMAEVTTEEVFKAAAADDELTLGATSPGITQFVLPFNVMSVGTVESFFIDGATVGTAGELLAEGGATVTEGLPVLDGATTGLVLGTDRLAVVTKGVPEEEALTLNASTVRTHVGTEVAGVSELDAAGDSQGVDSGGST